MAARSAEAGGDEPDQGDEPEFMAPVRCERPGPQAIDGWVDEIVAVYARVPDAEGRREPRPGEANALLVAAVRGSLASRAAGAPPAVEEEIIGVVEELVGELDAMGPEWESLREVRPLAFTIYYLWTHIVIDQISDDLAMEVVRAATARLKEFERTAPSARGARDRRPGAN